MITTFFGVIFRIAILHMMVRWIRQFLGCDKIKCASSHTKKNDYELIWACNANHFYIAKKKIAHI